MGIIVINVDGMPPTSNEFAYLFLPSVPVKVYIDTASVCPRLIDTSICVKSIPNALSDGRAS